MYLLLRLFETVRTEKPEFVGRPYDQEITEGQDGSFQVVATGRPEPTINWYYIQYYSPHGQPCKRDKDNNYLPSLLFFFCSLLLARLSLTNKDLLTYLLTYLIIKKTTFMLIYNPTILR